MSCRPHERSDMRETHPGCRFAHPGYDHEHTLSFSRQALSEACKSFTPRKKRGRREDRVHAAPAVSCANAHKENAHEHTGSAEAVRPSLRNGFTAYFVLSPVIGLSCHRRPQEALAA